MTEKTMENKEIQEILKTMTEKQLRRLDAVSSMLMAVLLCATELKFSEKKKKD